MVTFFKIFTFKIIHYSGVYCKASSNVVPFRKIRKLYPLHLLMLLAGSVYWLMMQRETISGILKKLAITVPLIQTWFPVGYQGINSVQK